MTRWRCPICDDLITKPQLFPIRHPKTRKWVGAYHRICMEIFLADLMGWFDAYERQHDLRGTAKSILSP
jgi:hypothetical protein